MENVLHIKLNVSEEISVDLSKKEEIQIDKSSFGTTDKERLEHNVLAVARKNLHVRKFVVDLANHGFFLVDHQRNKGISVFRALRNYQDFLSNFHDDNVQTWNDVYYTLEKPLSRSASCRLLVVFSSIADFPLNASISRRSFYKNWKSVQKYIPQNTFVLRIADIGGVLGSFYLNSKFNFNFENKIQSLLREIAEEFCIKKRNIILFGTSKGATGALYHGILGDYQTVAVDPIVSEKYYIDKLNDLHFVLGSFAIDFEEKFTNLVKEKDDLTKINVITSPVSHQFEHIRKIAKRKDNANLFIFSNPNIKSHPDVGPQTLPFFTSLINSIYYNTYNFRDFETEY